MNLQIKVVNNGTLSPDDWTEYAVEQLLYVADTAPEPIRAQAMAFKERIRDVVRHIVASAVEERRSRDALLAETNGQPDLAAVIRGDK